MLQRCPNCTADCGGGFLVQQKHCLWRVRVFQISKTASGKPSLVSHPSPQSPFCKNARREVAKLFLLGVEFIYLFFYYYFLNSFIQSLLCKFLDSCRSMFLPPRGKDFSQLPWISKRSVGTQHLRLTSPNCLTSSCQSRYLHPHTVPTWEELLPKTIPLKASTLCWGLLQLDQALHLFMG